MIWLALAGAIFLVWFVLVLLFAPGIGYRVRARVPLDAPEFLHTLASMCQARILQGNSAEVFTGGAAFYPAMLDAIRAAGTSITMECYIFKPDHTGTRFIDALAERARHGVTVTLVLDAVGSADLGRAEIGRLRDAGVRVEFYRALSWHTIARMNNRTHRELLIVDGRIAFTGGAGIADWWSGEAPGQPAWRDMMVRVEGPIVSALQGVAAENWLECCGEILTGPEFFPAPVTAGDVQAFVVRSSPADRATASRVAFQMLIEAAQRDVVIHTPYFLPDKALRVCLIGVVQRGVRVTIVVPGPRTDQRWVRLASRRGFKSLLAAGVRILEYQPAMTHCKMLIIDDDWAVVGTTNMDNRSFEHNDEVNLALCEPQLAARLRSDHERDLPECEEITLERWHERPWWEKVLGPVVWILERQQ